MTSPFLTAVLIAIAFLGQDDVLPSAPGHDDEIVISAPDAETVAVGIDAAVAFLLENQEAYEADPPVGRIPDGEMEEWQGRERERLRELQAQLGPGSEWPYEGVYRVGPERSIPAGYRVGGSAIVCMALIEAPGWESAPERQAAVLRSARFMLEMIESDPDMAPGPKQGYDVRGWGHVYALSFFLRALDLALLAEDDLRERVVEAIPHLVHCIAVNEEPTGGWNYAGRSTSPFMTGSTLIALFHAHARGYEVDPALIERALDALESGRSEAGSFAYAGQLQGEVPMPGSSARAAIAELCLFRAGRSSEARLRAAVHGFFDGWDDLFERKSQQGTHEGPYGIAPYYFYFGHTYAALAIEHLRDGTNASERDQLLDLLWRTRRGDGSWNDRIFPRTSSYSTAMSALALLAPGLPPVEAWTGPE